MARFYGQFDTDRYIAEYFDYIGTCIEVGASHGTVSSNTYYFEQLGWKCLCIEPNPDLFRQLVVNRDRALNYAVSNDNEDNVPFAIVELVGGDVTALSSLEIDQELFKQHSVNSVREITVNKRTLDFCIEEAKLARIDFISIDTEGTELDVLHGFDILRWKPKLLVIENNHNTDTIEQYLKDFGYVLDKRIVVNDFYTYQCDNALR